MSGGSTVMKTFGNGATVMKTFGNVAGHTGQARNAAFALGLRHGAGCPADRRD
jgi:hypothetical protein